MKKLLSLLTTMALSTSASTSVILPLVTRQNKIKIDDFKENQLNLKMSNTNTFVKKVNNIIYYRWQKNI